MLIVLMVLAVLLVAVLSIWAWRLLQQVKRQEAEQKRQVQALEDDARAQRDRVNKSIQIIANTIVAGDKMSLTEAAMRLGVLLESLGIDDVSREQLAPLFKLAEATAHIPILEEWKKLPTKKKLAFDKQREALEQDYRDFVVQCCQNLRGRKF